MATSAQIEANRRNARSSTGPRTARGKASASRSARKHRLNIPITADPRFAPAIDELAYKILGEEDPALLQAARAVAEASLDLDRVTHAKHALLSAAFDDPNYDSRKNGRMKIKLFELICQYVEDENPPRVPRSVSRRFDFLQTTPKAVHRLAENLVLTVMETKHPVERYAIALREITDKLVIFDRYRRRTLSRLIAAIQAFDEARRELHSVERS
jgi:hypothetical protein